MLLLRPVLAISAMVVFLATPTRSPAEIIDSCSLTRWDALTQLVKDKRDLLFQKYLQLQKESIAAWKKKATIKKKTVLAIYRLHQRIMLLDAALDNLDSLQDSPTCYALHETDDGDEGDTYYDIVGHRILFRIHRGSAANFIHETTHGGQFEHGSMAFRKVRSICETSIEWATLTARQKDSVNFSAAIGDDYDDEVGAYRAQFAFDPGSIPGLSPRYQRLPADAITIDMVMALKNTAGVKIYDPGSSARIAWIPVDVNSDRNSLSFDIPRASWVDGDHTQPLKDDRYYLFKGKKGVPPAPVAVTVQNGYSRLATPSCPPRWQ